MFLQNLRAKVGARLNGDSEAGFTLIELLVVMLILGILAAIAIPAFFNQREKANDAQAKSMARTAETAAETYSTEHGGEYVGINPTFLHNIEETISVQSESEAEAEETPGTPYLSVAQEEGGGAGYIVTVTDPSTENTFSIKREAGSGVPKFECTKPEQGGCPAGGNWSK
jgi:type IV pilus assembly protein PilA